MKLLKQKTSGEIFVWTPDLEKREDMELYERPVAKAADEVVVPPEPIQTESPEEDIKQIAQAVLKRRKSK